MNVHNQLIATITMAADDAQREHEQLATSLTWALWIALRALDLDGTVTEAELSAARSALDTAWGQYGSIGTMDG